MDTRKVVGVVGAVSSLLTALWAIRILNTPPPGSAVVGKHLTLADGRNLCYHIRGNPHHPHAMIYIHGTPSSRLEAGGTSEGVLEELGFYMISLDKPGYGQSHAHATCTLESFTHDVAALADHLQVAQFFVMATSGGGAYGWACLKFLPDRVRGLITISAAAPLDNLSADEWANAGHPGLALLKRLQSSSRLAAGAVTVVQRGLYDLALTRVGSRLLYHLVVKPVLASADRKMAAIDQQCLTMHPDYMQQVIPEALAQESAAALVHDLSLIMGRWPFNISEIPDDIASSAHIWHGVGDLQVPYQQAEKYKQLVPAAHLHIVPNGGHFAYYVCDMLNQRKALQDLLRFARHKYLA